MPYSLLEQGACSTRENHHKVEQTIFGKIMQMKKNWTMPVFCCKVIKSMMNPYRWFHSARGVV